MTTTSTTDLAGILAAKKAQVVYTARENGQPGDVIDADVDIVTGEIVPGTAVEPASANATVPAVPAPVEVRYPEIPPKVVGGLPYVRDYMKLAKTICNTEFVPAAFRGRPDVICAAYMRGYEMGFGPMQALDSFHPIEGRVGLTSEAMRALIMEDGHDIIINDLADDQGNVTAVRADCHRKQWPADKWASYTFTMVDARTAGLLAPSRSGKPTAWQKYPRDMLQARASSGAARRYFADVIAGMSYTPEEIRDFSGPDQEVTPSPAPASSPETAPSTVSTDAPTPASSQNVTSASPAPPSTESQASPSDTASPPKRPRGRPRKAQSAPIDAPGPSVSETPNPAPERSQETVLSILPEQTSLNTDGAIPAVAKPSEADIIREQLEVLKGMINTLPTVQQPLCRAFIRQHYPDGTADLKPVDVQKCIDIAAGWPESAAQHPIADELPF